MHKAQGIASRWLSAVAGTLLVAAAPCLGIAQPANGSAGFDIRTIDPESFRALAFKVPEGLSPKIDGRLNETIWEQAPVQGNFIQREPDYGRPSAQRTEFRVLYDDKTLYFGIWLWDTNPAGIMGSELKRDSGLNKGDQIKITIDTFHDHRNAFYFSTNPLGAYKDANTVENGRTINYDWNAVWDNKTSQDDKGWYVELAIPLSQLRFKTAIGESTWGLNLCRILFRDNEESYWVPFPREWGANGFARVSNAGVLGGLRNIKARRRLELVPFALPTGSRDYVAQTDADRRMRFGGDLKVGITNDLTGDFTFHTDFAQVEADQEVVNLTRFSLFFPEKRQFFTEAVGIFDYGKGSSSLGGDAAINDPGILSIFYSRRIGLVDGQEVPIVGGARVTGRLGDYSVGVLNIETDDARIGVTRTNSGQAVSNANFTVVRVKRNILSKSTVGAILLNSDGGISEYNRAFGVDTGIMLGQATTVTGLFAKTDSARDSGDDVAGVVDVVWKSDRFNYGAQYQDIGRQFNAEMGFIPRIDIRASKFKAAWTPRPKWPGVRQAVVQGSLDYYEDHSGRVDSRTERIDASLSRQDTSSARVSFTREYDSLIVPFATAGTSLPIGDYSWQTLQFVYSSNRTKRVFGQAIADVGGYYNGDRRSAQLNLNVQLGKTLLFEPNYTRNHITLPGRPAYTSNVVNFRVSHSFSPDFYLKGFVQYNDDRKTASFNFLWWYHYRPGSDLYLVYNQGNDTHLALTSAEALAQSHRVHSRSLALKLTYWLAR
jgi:hypothetical protein